MANFIMNIVVNTTIFKLCSKKSQKLPPDIHGESLGRNLSRMKVGVVEPRQNVPNESATLIIKYFQ